MPGPGEMAQWLKALVLTEDQGSLPSHPHRGSQPPVTTGNTLFQPPQAPGIHVVCIHTCRQNIHALKNKSKTKSAAPLNEMVSTERYTGLACVYLLGWH